MRPSRLFKTGALLLALAVVRAGGQVCIPTPAGPEDLAAHPDDPARFIVSCDPRREAHGTGVLVQVDLAAGTVTALERVDGTNLPAFRPHGISVVRGEDGATRVYVISHEAPRSQAVLRYAWEGAQLILEERILAPAYLRSPNDLLALPDGTLFVANDYGPGKGSFLWRNLRGARNCNVARRGPDGAWTNFATRLRMANSLATDGRELFVSTTRGGEILAYPLAGGAPRVVARKLGSLDNLSWSSDRQLLVARHPSNWRFYLHALGWRRTAPSEVWRIDPAAARPPARIFADNGERISAVSVAVEAPGPVLMLGQIFGDHLLVVTNQVPTTRAPAK